MSTHNKCFEQKIENNNETPEKPTLPISLVGWGQSFLYAWPTGVQLVFFFCSGVIKLLGAQRGSPSSGSLLYICESSFLINHGIYHDLFVCSLTI